MSQHQVTTDSYQSIITYMFIGIFLIVAMKVAYYTKVQQLPMCLEPKKMGYKCTL